MAESFQANSFQNNSFDVTAGGAASHERAAELEATADIASSGTSEESPAGEHARSASFDMVADVAARGHTSVHVRAASLTVLADFTTVVAAYKVQDLVAVAVSSSSIHLTWDDTALTDETYDIERDGEVFLTGYDGLEYTDTGLDPGTTYTYRVRANGTTSREGQASFTAMGLIEADGFAETPEIPASITGLVAWYDFSDASTLFTDTARTTAVSADGNTIAGVTDKSGVGNHLSQSTSGKRPTYKTAIVNGGSVARFVGGSQQQLVNASFSVITNATIFVVFYKTGATSHGFFSAGPSVNQSYDVRCSVNNVQCCGYSGSQVVQLVGTLADSIWATEHLVHNGSTIKSYQNGVLGDSDSLGATSVSTVNMRLGGLNDGTTWCMSGDLVEVIVYSTGMSVADQNLLGNYLQAKHNLSAWTTVT